MNTDTDAAELKAGRAFFGMLGEGALYAVIVLGMLAARAVVGV